MIALEPGNEHEAVPRRMQLFKQINIIENGNQTRIVSNPADVAFSDDGGKAYVTMSGSEDLAVFDLARALPIDSKSPKAATTDGAHAVEIFRHLPGRKSARPRRRWRRYLRAERDGPRPVEAFYRRQRELRPRHLGAGELRQARRYRSGRAGSRRGERIFTLANTSVFPDAPLTGNNWMSCSSCHVDGFNFTNRALFRDTPVDKFIPPSPATAPSRSWSPAISSATTSA